MTTAVIVDIVRTPSGKGKSGGALSGVHPAALLGQTLTALVDRNGLDTALVDDVINPRGGAIALGHPLGGSGTKLMATLLNYLEATGGRYGLQTMCEGGGMANATIIERL